MHESMSHVVISETGPVHAYDHRGSKKTYVMACGDVLGWKGYFRRWTEEPVTCAKCLWALQQRGGEIETRAGTPALAVKPAAKPISDFSVSSHGGEIALEIPSVGANVSRRIETEQKGDTLIVHVWVM